MAGYLIGDTLRLRLRETIDRVREMPEGERPTRLDARFEDVPRPAAGGMRIIAFTGGWAKSTLKTVTIDPTTATMTVSNIFASIPAAGCSKKGAAAKINGTWYLISAEGG